MKIGGFPMRQFTMMLLTLCVAFTLATTRAADEKPKGQAKKQNNLVGTWKLVSAKYGGRESKLPEGTTHIKHITPTQFMWATYDQNGTLLRAAGGSYTLKGEDYEEAPEYGIGADFELIKGKAHSFKCKVDGDTWHQNGKLSNDLTIEEVWERVKKP
jgi:hypothetical protein